NGRTVTRADVTAARPPGVSILMLARLVSHQSIADPLRHPCRVAGSGEGMPCRVGHVARILSHLVHLSIDALRHRAGPCSILVGLLLGEKQRQWSALAASLLHELHDAVLQQGTVKGNDPPGRRGLEAKLLSALNVNGITVTKEQQVHAGAAVMHPEISDRQLRS